MMKKLPRNDKGQLSRTFKANGNEYRILDPILDGISIDRFTKFQQMALVSGYNASFSQFTQNLDRATEMVNNIVTGKNQLTDLVFHLASMKRGIVEGSNKLFDPTLYFCAVFIVRDGEDLTSYNEGFADEKIKDWNKEGYDVNDFFLLSRAMISDFKNIQNQAKKELMLAKIVG